MFCTCLLFEIMLKSSNSFANQLINECMWWKRDVNSLSYSLLFSKICWDWFFHLMWDNPYRMSCPERKMAGNLSFRIGYCLGVLFCLTTCVCSLVLSIILNHLKNTLIGDMPHTKLFEIPSLPFISLWMYGCIENDF